MLENKHLASSLLFVIYFVPSCLVFQKIHQNHSHQIPISNQKRGSTNFFSSKHEEPVRDSDYKLHRSLGSRSAHKNLGH